MTSREELIEEIRTARDEHARRCSHDLSAILRDIRSQQEASGQTYVTFPLRPAARIKVSAAG
jgi:hypothetical protein